MYLLNIIKNSFANLWCQEFISDFFNNVFF